MSLPFPCTTMPHCPGADSPVTNLSAEAPDQLVWATMVYPYNNPYVVGPSDNTCQNLAGGCEINCQNLLAIGLTEEEMLVAQNVLALNCNPAAVEGVTGFQDDSVLEDWIPPAPENPDYVEVGNAEQTQSACCSNGSCYTVTIAANTMRARVPAEIADAYVDMANAWAQVQAFSVASAELVCIERPWVEPQDEEIVTIDTRILPIIPPDAEPGPVLTPPTIPTIPWPPDVTPTPPTTPQTHPISVAPPATLTSYVRWVCAGVNLAGLGADANTYTVGGTGEYEFSISDGALPDGVTLVQTGDRTAMLSGTPTVPGTYNYTVKATKSGAYITLPDTLLVYGITSTPPAGNAGSYYLHVLTTDGGIGDTTYSLASGSLPDGLTLGSDGLISGIPSTAGIFTFGVQITDTTGEGCEQDVTITVNPCDWVLSVPSNGVLNILYSYTYTTLGGFGGYTYQILAGTLPPGITMDNQGSFTGAPSAFGTYSFTVLITDNTGQTCVKDSAITIEPFGTFSDWTINLLSEGPCTLDTWTHAPKSFIVAGHANGPPPVVAPAIFKSEHGATLVIGSPCTLNISMSLSGNNGWIDDPEDIFNFSINAGLYSWGITHYAPSLNTTQALAPGVYTLYAYFEASHGQTRGNTAAITLSLT